MATNLERVVEVGFPLGVEAVISPNRCARQLFQPSPVAPVMCGFFGRSPVVFCARTDPGAPPCRWDSRGVTG